MRGVMKHNQMLRNFILIALFVCCTAQAEQFAIYVFDKKLILPNGCKMFARVSVLDEQATFHCEEKSRQVKATIYLLPIDKCTREQYEERNNGNSFFRALVDQEVNGLWYLEHDHQTSQKDKFIITRQVRGKEVCLRVLSQSRAYLDELTGFIW